MPYPANQARRQKFPKTQCRVSSLHEYDQAWQEHARCRRGLAGTRDGEARSVPVLFRCGHRDRADAAPRVCRPWRPTEGLLRSIATRLGVNLEIPDHTTFSRRSAGNSLTTALKRNTGPVDVVIDSTGLKVYGAGEWQAEKHGGRGRRTWRKLHLAVHPGSGEILASELTTNEVGDLSMVGPLLDQIPGDIASVMADGAYDGEPVYRAIAERQPQLPPAVIIPPRATAVLSPTADTAPNGRDQHI